MSIKRKIYGARGKAVVVLAGMVLFLLAACSVGPQVLKGNRLDYNVSIQRSNNEELLLNLVRARYGEPFFFLQVGSVSSSFGFSSTVGVGGTFFDRTPGPNQSFASFINPSLGAGISENPTITYTPIQGEKAVRQLQSEVRLDRFLILHRTSWSIQSLMWLLAQRIGTGSNYSPDFLRGDFAMDSYLKFLDIVQVLNNMDKRGDLEFIGIPEQGRGVDSAVMQICYLDQQEAETLEKLLNIKPDHFRRADGRLVATIEMTTVRDLSAEPKKKDGRAIVSIKLKSFVEVMNDLAINVEVPTDEEDNHIVRPKKPISGNLKERLGMHAGLVVIKSSSALPSGAYVAVPYRGRWYYIADNDLRSKGYLIIIGSIFSLQSGDLQTTTPLLTLPLGR